MMLKPTSRILARVDRNAFVGREAETAALGEAIRAGRPTVVMAQPGSGSSELLRQVFDRSFGSGDGPAPFFFKAAEDESSAEMAARFVREFLTCIVAYRRSDPGVIAASPEVCEISELAQPGDGPWIDRLIESCRADSRLNDDRAFIRAALSAPARAASRGVPNAVLIDRADLIADEECLGMLRELASTSGVSLVFGCRRRHSLSREPLNRLHLRRLDTYDAAQLVSVAAEEAGLVLNEQVRDLVAILSGGAPRAIQRIVGRAAETGIGLSGFARTASVYTDLIYGGLLGADVSSAIERLDRHAGRDLGIVQMLMRTITSGSTSLADWQKHSRLMSDEIGSVIARLHVEEVVNAAGGRIVVDDADLILCDTIRALDSAKNPGRRARQIAESAAAFARRSPQLMSEHYRRSSLLDLRELMLRFDGQPVPKVLLDGVSFRDKLKGLDKAGIKAALAEEKEMIHLPRIAFAAHTADLYPPIAAICSRERSAIAVGVDASGQREIARLAVEIDQKLEADLETAVFWLDRLEMAAAACDLAEFRIWLVAREGFTAEAHDAITERRAVGSSRRQAEMLSTFLSEGEDRSAEPDRYELTIPMGSDTEMIAAHMAEEVARRHEFPPRSVNQIKTAVVEACINAAEHGLSPDRRIRLSFAFGGGRLTVDAENRGIRLLDRDDAASEPSAPRRGWGLKLIRGLMDEVTIIPTDDGTLLRMAKILAK